MMDAEDNTALKPATVDEAAAAEDDTLKQVPSSEAGHSIQEPSRVRRAVFVFGSALASYSGAMALSFLGTGKIAELVADGLITYMIAIGVTYIAGHSIDRSELLSKLGESFTRRYTSPPSLKE